MSGTWTKEVSSYAELLTEEKIRGGISAAVARRAALLEIEGPTQVKESVRQARTGASLEQAVSDLRYGWRLLRKNPGFTTVAMLTLALGIGANTAIFSVLYSVLLKPLPYGKTGEIVRVWQASHAMGFDQLGLSEGQFVSLRNQKRFFSELGIYQFDRGFINNGDETENVFVAAASAGVLESLGVQPLLGRGFQPQDEVEGSAPVAILSYELWQRWYGGNDHVLGKTIRINDKLGTIVGVLPKGFLLPEDFVGSETIQAWIPRELNTASPRWASYSLTPVARLRPGTSAPQATAELRPYLEQLYSEHPIEGNTLQAMGWDVDVKNVHDDLVGGVKKALWILACAVGVVLLIVCANVASLMLARSAARQKEMAVRVALGAQGIRIVRQLLTESLLISLLGGVVGLALAHWGLKLIVGLAAYNVPRLDQVTINLPALFFTLAISLLAGLIFG
ncbi:MAG TPA: ABC transporter permease, partial [Candidatus Angelobacter sp.]|nr:ABC transporter permease [Candidatus Angelobacter sp.]